MKNVLKMGLLLILLTNVGFAQQNELIPKLPEKDTLQQKHNSDKAADTTVQNDLPIMNSVEVAGGKKGLNAVNVRQTKQAGNNANSQIVSPPEKGSTTVLQQSKHAIITKGTGATRDK